MSYAFVGKAARLAGMACLAAIVASCTMKEQEAPDFMGPSEFAKSIAVQVTPDIITQDGASQSLITVIAKGPNGEPLRDVQMRAEIQVNGTPVDFGSLSARTLVTNADGRATVVYTAPPGPSIGPDTGTVVDVVIRPIGSDFNNATIKTAAIRLVPPGIVIPPDGLRALFTSLPSAPLDGQDVFFDAGTSQPAGGIASFSWDFGDGSHGSGRTTTHSFTAGVFHVTLTITDAFGRTASTTNTITVGASAAPTAVFVFSPTAPRVNQNIAFNASGSRAPAGQTIVSYTWDFGDGTPRVTTGTPTINRVYTVAGSYAVTLLVTDSNGQIGTVTGSVTVTP
jgi:PKD repeat protein